MENIFKRKEVSKKKHVVIGTFESLHLGHKNLIEKAKGKGTNHVTVFTFDKKYNSNEKEILDKRNRIRLLKLLGANTVHVLKMEEIYHLSPDEFIKTYLQPVKPDVVFMGEDFKFGKNRYGDVNTLEKYFKVEVIKLKGDKIGKYSTTRVREAIRLEDFKTFKKLTGRNYFVCGQIYKGLGQARKLGAPSANVKTTNLIPPAGVYFVYAHIKGKIYPSIAAISQDNKVPGELKLEVHILDFSENIYKHRICVEFIKLKRHMIHTPDKAILSRQIKTDIFNAKVFFKVI